MRFIISMRITLSSHHANHSSWHMRRLANKRRRGLPRCDKKAAEIKRKSSSSYPAAWFCTADGLRAAGDGAGVRFVSQVRIARDAEPGTWLGHDPGQGD